jgi:hypothetical protein
MKNEEKLFCPFCINSSICDGPHITSKKDEINMFNYINNVREDYIHVLIKEIKKYSIKTGIDLEELIDIVKEKLNERDK